MSNNLGPYDIMRYHSQLTEFFEPYINEVEVNNSLLTQIEKTGKRIDSYFKTGTIDFTPSVRNVIILGSVVENIGEFSVVKPNGDYREESAEEIYAQKLLREANFWKTAYELEIAQFCNNRDLDTRLVHEGQQCGPDIFVYCDDKRIDIECKRRDAHLSDVDYDYEQIREEIHNRIDIGEDSFFIELTADGPLEEEARETVIELAVETVENRSSESTANINGIEYKIILKGYYHGKKESDISKKDVERWFNEQVFTPQKIQALLSPFDTDMISSGSYIEQQFCFTKDGDAITKNSSVFDFNFPTIDDKYYDRVVNTTLKSGFDDLKSRSPAILFLHLPADETEGMERYFVQEGNYEPTPQIQRLEQRIDGELKYSDSVNAVVLNGTHFIPDENNCRIERGYKVIKNPSPDSPLPQDFEDFLF